MPCALWPHLYADDIHIYMSVAMSSRRFHAVKKVFRLTMELELTYQASCCRVLLADYNAHLSGSLMALCQDIPTIDLRQQNSCLPSTSTTAPHTQVCGKQTGAYMWW